jgi:hypothetical protein
MQEQSLIGGVQTLGTRIEEENQTAVPLPRPLVYERKKEEEEMMGLYKLMI